MILEALILSSLLFNGILLGVVVYGLSWHLTRSTSKANHYSLGIVMALTIPVVLGGAVYAGMVAIGILIASQFLHWKKDVFIQKFQQKMMEKVVGHGFR